MLDSDSRSEGWMRGDGIDSAVECGRFGVVGVDDDVEEVEGLDGGVGTAPDIPRLCYIHQPKPNPDAIVFVF